MEAQLARDVSLKLKRFQEALGAVEAAMEPLLALSTRELEAQLEPRERAEAHITLAQAVDVLQRMQWRACGVDEDTREWKETDRIQRYKKKLKKLINDEELAVTRRSLTLDVGAANRFIDAAIPDLPEDQKKAIRKVKAQQVPASIRSRSAGKRDSLEELAAEAKKPSSAADNARSFLQQLA